MKTISMRTIAFIAVILSLTSCKKAIDSLINRGQNSKEFVHHIITQGQHSSNISNLQTSEYEAINFIVKFDSSAVYSTANPANQLDINKLYGFADNNTHHHQFSARFGWRWSAGALRLFAYNYNEGVVSHKELGIVEIGKEIECGIKIEGNNYIFSLNGKKTQMPRMATTALARGYRLFPYFGGDEPAPHDVHIWIKEK